MRKTTPQQRVQIINLVRDGKISKTDIGKRFNITRQAIIYLSKRPLEFYV